MNPLARSEIPEDLFLDYFPSLSVNFEILRNVGEILIEFLNFSFIGSGFSAVLTRAVLLFIAIPWVFLCPGLY